MVQTTYYGSCLCGAIQLEIQGEPDMITRCHCWNCRKQTGCAFSPNIRFLDSEFRITSGADNLQAYCDNAQKSGNSIYRHFCKTCGSSLFVSQRPDAGVSPCPDGESALVVVPHYSALDYRIRYVEGGDGEAKEVKEKIEEAPTIEFHVRDRLGWVAPLESAEQVRTKPGRPEDD